MAILVAPAFVPNRRSQLGPVESGSNHHRYGEFKTRLTIDPSVKIHLPDSKEKKGLQLALKPLNGRSIAGYVLKP
jgi:hypothetical protein